MIVVVVDVNDDLVVVTVTNYYHAGSADSAGIFAYMKAHEEQFDEDDYITMRQNRTSFHGQQRHPSSAHVC